MQSAAGLSLSPHISDVAEALGGEAGRTRRPGVAVWRKDRDFSVSINDAQGFWHDFVTNHGGGVIDLVVKVLGDSQGRVHLAGCIRRSFTRHRGSRRRYARRMQAAMPKAEALVLWKMETGSDFGLSANVPQQIYHNACSLGTLLPTSGAEVCGDVHFELEIEIGGTYWPRSRS